MIERWTYAGTLTQTDFADEAFQCAIDRWDDKGFKEVSIAFASYAFSCVFINWHVDRGGEACHTVPSIYIHWLIVALRPQKP